ncbi:MAG: hypothetical protein JRJ84_24165, partial [Deltaproteobacteria bacterium]|nr:hypothetical protein [Deltaproteobacteria bacterium]
GGGALPPEDPAVAPGTTGTEPAEEEEALAKPVSTLAGTVMVRREGAPHCDLFLVSLPALTEREMAPMPCDANDLWVEPTGKRMTAGRALVDIEAGALVEFPPLPSHDTESLRAYRFGPQGGIFATLQWGSGSLRMGEERLFHEVQHGSMFRLEEETWVEQMTVSWKADSPVVEVGQDRWEKETSAFVGAHVWLAEGPWGDWVQDEELIETLNGRVEVPPDQWFVDAGEPRLAHGMDGEGSYLHGPALLEEGGAWVVLEEVPGYPRFLDRRGDWLLMGGKGWKLYDLEGKAVVARNEGTAWFWPEGVPVP